MAELLTVSKIVKRFGGLRALDGVDLMVQPREIVGLIGPNGAGKSTLFEVISGTYRPDEGTITFEGKDITNIPSHEICSRGIGRTYQIVRPFAGLSVLENAMIGALFGKNISHIAAAKRDASDWIDFVGLSSKKNVKAGSLTIQERKLLEMARALASEPKLILLDEVMAGLNATEADATLKLIKKVRDEHGTAFVMVEHVMRAVMSISDRVVVLNNGAKIAEGRPDQIINNQTVIDAYLGAEFGASNA